MPTIVIALAFLVVVVSFFGGLAYLLLKRPPDDNSLSDRAWDGRLCEAVRELPDGGGMKRLRARYHRWNAREQVYVSHFNEECPMCHAPVVSLPKATRAGLSFMLAPRTEEELIGCCPEHGRAPFNTPTLRRIRLEAEKQYAFTDRRR